MQQSPTSSPPAERRWGPPWLAVASLLALAAVLRLVGIRYGLPFPLLDPDEQNIVPRAWAIVHGGGADPHWFEYPTGLIYLLAPSQLWHGAPSYLAARIAVAGLGVAAVGASWWLGRRAYDRTAAVVAAALTAVATTHVAYSHAAVTDVPLTLFVAISLAFAVRGQVELAGFAAGLATGVKYSGLLLAVPVVVAGWKRWPRVAAGLILLVGGFLASSPYVLVHRSQAWHDLARVQRRAREGWLGFEHDHWAGIAFGGRLWHAIGPALLVAVIGLVLALVHRRRSDLVLASFCLAYYADLLTLHAHFDRYVLPLVPALGALAGRLRSLAPVTLLLLAIPLAWSIRNDSILTRTDTRVRAHAWIEEHLPAGATVAAESSTPTLSGFRIVALALPGPKRGPDPNRDVARLRAEGVGYVVVTGAVADRVLRARDRYPAEARFYEELDRTQRVYRLDPGRSLAGPWVAVYDLRQ